MCSGLFFFTIGKKKVQSSRQLLLERRACFTARWEWRRWRKAGKQNLSIWWASRMFWTQLHTSHWNSPTGIISAQNYSVHYHSQDQALQDKGLLTTHKHPPRKEKNKIKIKKNRSRHLRRFLLCALNNFPCKCGGFVFLRNTTWTVLFTYLHWILWKTDQELLLTGSLLQK